MLSVIGYANYATAKRTIMAALIETSYSKVENAADRLGMWLQSRRAEVEVMSRTGQVRFGSDAERLQYLRAEQQRAGTTFKSIGFADPSGRVTLSSGKSFDIADEPTFAQALTGRTTIAVPRDSRLDGVNIIVIQVPAYDSERHIEGVVVASLPTQRIYAEQLNVHVGTGDELFMYEQDGTIFHAPEGSELSKAGSILSQQLSYQSEVPQMTGSAAGYARLREASGEAIAFFAPVGDTGWHLALHVPLDEVEAPLAALKWRSIWLIVLAEALLTLLLFAYSNPVIRRIKRILSVTEAAAAGRFDVGDVRDAGHDELSQLSHSVNGMKTRLSDMFGQMDAMINQNQFAFIVLDKNYRVTYFSKAAERMLGYTAEEVIHHATALTFIDPLDIEREARRLSGKYGRPVPPSIQVFELLRKENFSYEREWNYMSKDGTRIPVAHSSNGMRDQEGRFIGVAGIARDISDQKLAEKARNQQLKAMGAAKDLIATFDENGLLLYINPAGRALLGLQEGDDYMNDMPLRTIAELLDGIDDARKIGYQENEALLRTLQGVFIPVSKILVVHRDDVTEETFYSCIARDISEAKRVQYELEQAKREAESANIAKSHFLAQISHEIRTPLAGIIGLTGLLQKTELTPLQADYLHKTRDSSEALLAIINDILDFSKVEAGKVELNEVPFDPYALVHKLAELLSVFVGSKERFQFIVDTPARLPELLIGDWQRIEQILLNLCVNAIKFTENGHVRLHLQLLDPLQADGGDTQVRVAFHVEDTGIGMTEEQLGRLFKPFMQADSGTNRKYGGTGLGLVIVKRLAELMGGAIQARSAYGQGSVFAFTVNLTVAEPPRPDRFTIRGGEESVLWVVENHPLMGELLGKYMEESGLAPILLQSWKTARERLERSGIGVRPHALLLDFEMPDMYGEETWQAMRVTAQDAGVRTIALTTAFGREELLKLPPENRPDAILVKPVTRISLYRAMQPLFGVPEREAFAGAGEAAATSSLPERMSGTILLAEDNAINQTVAIEQLREWGFHVDVAESGTAVLKLLPEKRYDLILMDIHMPEMDGDEAARIIRLDSRHDRLPIIALTANIMQEDHDRYMQLGINDVLTKPIEPGNLLQVIDKWLRYGKEPRADAARAKPKEREMANAVYMSAQDEANGWLSASLIGMSVEEALQRVNGKRDILAHMLKVFVRDYRYFTVRLEETLLANDYAAARRMAHTLKGAAGNLSADALCDAASRLEQLLWAEGVGEEPAAQSAALAGSVADVDATLRELLASLIAAMPTFDTFS